MKHQRGHPCSDDILSWHCSDGFEPNETCDEYLPLGTVFEDDSEESWTARIYPAGDEDTFRFFAEENLYHLFDLQHEQDF